MTEQEFWRNIETALQAELETAGEVNQKFIRRLMKLLEENAEDLRDADAKERTELLKKLFRQAGLNKYWRTLQDSFSRILDMQNRLWRRETTRPSPLARSNSRLTAFEKVQFDKFGKIGRDAVDELHREFERAAREGLTRRELIETIRPIGEKVGSYAGAIADTALRGWDRTVTATKAEIAGVDTAIYDGPPPIETSHWFCIEHYQGEYTREEIEAMSNGQLDPVITYGGGYNCRHRWRWRIEEILK